LHKRGEKAAGGEEIPVGAAKGKASLAIVRGGGLRNQRIDVRKLLPDRKYVYVERREVFRREDVLEVGEGVLKPSFFLSLCGQAKPRTGCLSIW
jgi:hypothetical protein